MAAAWLLGTGRVRSEPSKAFPSGLDTREAAAQHDLPRGQGCGGCDCAGGGSGRNSGRSAPLHQGWTTRPLQGPRTANHLCALGEAPPLPCTSVTSDEPEQSEDADKCWVPRGARPPGRIESCFDTVMQVTLLLNTEAKLRALPHSCNSFHNSQMHAWQDAGGPAAWCEQSCAPRCQLRAFEIRYSAECGVSYLPQQRVKKKKKKPGPASTGACHSIHQPLSCGWDRRIRMTLSFSKTVPVWDAFGR